VNRRGFLQLLGSTIALSAGGIALLEPEPIKAVTYFLPPAGGWAHTLPGAWELALAKEALDVIDRRLSPYAERIINPPLISGSDGSWGVYQEFNPEMERLLARREALVRKIDYLVKGGKPMGVRQDGFVRVHGGRSPVPPSVFMRNRMGIR
jgi:hypothetical protein